MIFKHTSNNLTWIDLEKPSSEEIRQVLEERNIHPVIAQELIGPSKRAKVEVYPELIYLTLHFPVVGKVGKKHSSRKVAEEREIDFIIGKNFIITRRFGPFESLRAFSKLFEVNSILNKDSDSINSDFVFSKMMKTLYGSLYNELESLNDAIKDIENNIFKGRERAMVEKLSEVSRELLDARRAVGFHKEILASLDYAGETMFGKNFGFYSREILGEYYKIKNTIDGSLEFVAELRETNNSLLNTKETETMKRLTIIAFLALPASVITNFFQMSTAHTPIVGIADDWLIIMIILFASTLFLFGLAKMKKWF